MNAAAPNTTSAIAQDGALFEKTHTYTNADLLVAASKMSGKSSLELGRDFLRHGKSGRGVELADYVRYKLWDAETHGEDGAARFVGANMHWPIVDRVNSPLWRQVAEDKHVMHAMIASAGLPRLETLAFIDSSIRIVPGVEKISEPEALRDLFTSHPDGSLFLKTVGGMTARGAMIIEAADATSVKCTDQEAMSYADFLEKVVGPNPYLVQKRQANHAAIAPYLSALATIRFPNFMGPEGPFSPCVAMRFPTAGNISCAYWRPGNMIGELDIQTGRVLSLTRPLGPSSENLEDHPERPGLVGMELPFWKEILELNETAAKLFSPISYNSTDIALTPDGPVLVEVNYGGSFDILQSASGRGVLTDQMTQWFAEHGMEFTRKRRKFQLIRSKS